MIKFSLPGFFCKFYYVKQFLEYYNTHLDFFYKDRIIDSFYDADCRLIWRGGRSTRLTGPVWMQDVIDTFNNYPSIKLRHTFTNCLINKDYLVQDHLCNIFVKNFIRSQDEVILNSPMLIDHFKKNYPYINIVYSTTLNIKDINQVNEISKNNIYVLNYNFNNEQKYLNQLEHKENIEILCAEPCQPNCPFRIKHYEHISKQMLCEDMRKFPCLAKSNNETASFDQIMTLSHAIDQIRLKELEQQGFQYFKISGRTLDIPQWLYTILYYLSLPQYTRQIFLELMTKWWHS